MRAQCDRCCASATSRSAIWLHCFSRITASGAASLSILKGRQLSKGKESGERSWIGLSAERASGTVSASAATVVPRERPEHYPNWSTKLFSTALTGRPTLGTNAYQRHPGGLLQCGPVVRSTLFIETSSLRDEER